MRIVDLSLHLAGDLPCSWPGLPPFEATVTLDLAADAVFSRSLRIEEHCGTHADAPCHIADADGAPVGLLTLDRVPLEHLAGPARVIDCRETVPAEPGISPWLDASIVHDYEARTGSLRAGDAVLLWTGWSDATYRPLPEGRAYCAAPLAGETAGWPAPTVELVDLLGTRGVRVFGLDTPSLGAAHDPFPAHRAALGRGITPVEGLTGIGRVTAGALFCFLPLPIRDASGSPGRAVAFLEGVS